MKREDDIDEQRNELLKKIKELDELEEQERTSKEVSLLDEAKQQIVESVRSDYLKKKATKGFCDPNSGLPFTGLAYKQHPNGQKSYEVTLKSGKKDGIERQWSGNGVLKIESPFKEGKKDGIEQRFFLYKKPKLKQETSFKNGKREGKDIQWFRNGQKRSEGSHVSGKKNGLWIEWGDDGVMTEKGIWDCGDREGLHQRWGYDGVKTEEVKYKKGRQVRYKSFTKSPIPRASGHCAANVNKAEDAETFEDKMLGWMFAGCGILLAVTFVLVAIASMFDDGIDWDKAKPEKVIIMPSGKGKGYKPAPVFDLKND